MGKRSVFGEGCRKKVTIRFPPGGMPNFAYGFESSSFRSVSMGQTIVMNGRPSFASIADSASDCSRATLALSAVKTTLPLASTVFTSVNPARSTGVALLAGPVAMSQLWLFWVAPIAGGLLGGVIYRWLGQYGPDVTGTQR